MTNEYKCFWSATCPYYERTTSYGTERIRCENTDCALYGLEEEGDEDDE